MARFGHTVISGIIWIAILVAVAIFGGRVSGALGDVFLYGGFAVAALFTWHLIRTIRLQVEGMSLMKRDPERFDRMRASYERASGATEKARSPVAPANQGGGSNQVWSLASAMEYADSEATRLWSKVFGLASPEPQARHGLSTTVGALFAAKDRSISDDDIIDVATGRLGDESFANFMAEEDVRAGLRSLVRDTRSAVADENLNKVMELVQTFLYMPLGKPTNMSRENARRIAEVAANISAQTIAASSLRDAFE